MNLQQLKQSRRFISSRTMQQKAWRGHSDTFEFYLFWSRSECCSFLLPAPTKQTLCAQASREQRQCGGTSNSVRIADRYHRVRVSTLQRNL